MAINFPSNPTPGDSYTFNNITWVWNGYAWDKTSAAGISGSYVSKLNGLTGGVTLAAGSNITLTPVGNIITITSTGGGTGSSGISGSYVSTIAGLSGAIGLSAGADITISGSGNTLTIASPTLYGICGAFYASSLSTGLLYGGLLTINAGNTATFDITAGAGYIVSTGATYNREPLPVITRVEWTAKTGVTLSGLASQDTTWVYIDSTGAIKQQAAFFTDDQVQSTIAVGALIHPSRSFISLAKTIPNVSYATDKQYEQFIRSFGPLKVSGHTIQANGANLKLNRTDGTAFILGRNYPNDPNNPSVVSDIAKTDAEIWRYYRGVTAGSFVTVTGITTGIDPTKYDNGSGTLASVSPSTPFTIQRVFFFPNTPNVLGVYYGCGAYPSLSEAANNIHLEDFTEITNTATNAVLTAFIIVKYNVTNLSTAITANDARIIQAGQFRTTSSGGGSIATKLDDLSDVIVSSPQDDDLLIYDYPTSQWLNTPLRHIGVSRFNGLTGNVTGVSSFNGATGAVTGVSSLNTYTNNITIGYGSGITASLASMDEFGNVSWSISNSGVLSFNGSNGAVTGISSFNGRTGSVQGVSAAVAGTGISVSGATGSVTITNTGVRSLNGFTGTVTITGGTGISVTSSIAGITIGLTSLIQGPTGATGATGSTGAIGSTGATGATGATGPVGDYVISFNGLTGAVTGVTLGGAAFTGLVSSTVGFSGAGTNLTGNASGLTAGTATKVQVTEAASLTSYSLALIGSTGATGIYTDTSAPKWSYLPSTGRLTTTSGGFQAPTVETDNIVSVAGTSPLYIKTPWSAPIPQVIVIGDVDGNNNGTNLQVDDLPGSFTFNGIGETQIQTSGGLALYNQYSLVFYDIQDPVGYVAFKAPSIASNVTWTLPSSDGSSNQVLTTNGSGTLSWTTPSGSGLTAYVSSFNGRTGAVQGVSAASAGTGIALSGATGAVTITNTGVLSFNGLTGAVSGVTTSAANTFTALQTFSNRISVNGATLSGTVSITGLSNPSVDSEAANKAYVDSVATSGVHYHDPVVLASTDAETFATGVTYSNGTSGIGATLTKTASFARINIDSTNGSTGDRILIRSATTQQWNGIYSVTDQGTVSSGWILTRTTDADEYHPYSNTGLGGNDYFYVSSGSTLRNSAYVLNTPGGITFGTTAITFSLFNQPPVYTAGTGIGLTGLQFSNTGVQSFNGFTGGVTLAVGTGVTFTASSGTITLSTTGSGGGISRSITSITGSTTAGSASSTDYVYIGTTSGNINLTMPTAVSNTNRYTVKQNNIGTLTILTTSSQTIDGVTGFALTRQYQAVDLISDNANWNII